MRRSSSRINAWRESGDIVPPPVRIVMESQEMLEEMVRTRTTSMGSRIALGALSPSSLSPRGGSRRGSWIAPIHSQGGSSKGSVLSRSDLWETLFCSTSRRKVVQEFVDLVMSWTPPKSNAATKPSKSRPEAIGRPSVNKQSTSSHKDDTLIEAAFAAGRWAVARFHRVVSEIREPIYKDQPPQPLGIHLVALHWTFLSVDAANDGRDDEVADAEVWHRFAVSVEGQDGPVPQQNDPESIMALMAMREGAEEYFTREVHQEVKKLTQEELITVLYFVTQFSSAAKLLEFIVPYMFRRMPEEVLFRDVVPTFVVLAVLQPDAVGVTILDFLFRDFKQFVSSEAANSALEFCAHMQRSNCCRSILDQVGHLLNPEGVIAAMIPVCSRGTDHVLAMLELFIMDKCQQHHADASGHNRGSRVDAMGARSLEEGVHQTSGSATNLPESSFAELLPPCVYMFLVLAAAGGYAKPSTVRELMEFHEDPCAPLLVGRVTEMQHVHFVKDLFHLVCQLNLTAIVWTMIEARWIPSDISLALHQAVELGHQSLVHILLDSLLIPDEKLEPPSGSLPLVFRKAQALSLLPSVANRFPAEAIWFLSELSSIPLPSCVPTAESQEPEVRPAPVRGTLMGTATLAEVTRRTETVVPSVHIWSRLNRKAQLRGVTIGTNTPDAECVICMAPEGLLSQEAYNDSVGGQFFRQPSPFIRLLETGDKDIVLQPVMQALMEYHWIAGGFWYRYALHLLLSLSFIASIWTMFVFIVQRQSGTFDDPEQIDSLIPITVIALALTTLFLIQEAREFLDDPGDYIHSTSNLLDMIVYISALFSAIRGAILGSYVPPILMGVTLIITCTRVLMQLRIIPSIGPIIRIWVSATKNILPVLVPFTVLALSFAGGFYLVQYQHTIAYQFGDQLHFTSIGQSIQSVLTMTAGDYSVLDFSQEAEVFVLRLFFHVIFIIFLVNLIIGLMTVNVANVTVNTTSAWLVEISQLMVELELYWPWPMNYRLQRHLTDESNSPDTHHGRPSQSQRSPGAQYRPPFKARNTRSPSRQPARVVHWWSCCCDWLFGTRRRSTAKVGPTTKGNPGMGRRNSSVVASSILSNESEINKPFRPSILVDTPEFYRVLQQQVVLYTCPEEQVAKTHWWKAGAKESDLRNARPPLNDNHRIGNLGTSGRSDTNGGAPGGPWNMVSKLLHLGTSGREERVASVPSLIGRSASSLPPIPAADEESENRPRSESLSLGLDMRLLDQVDEQEESAPSYEISGGMSFLDVRNRRLSRMNDPETASRTSIEFRRQQQPPLETRKSDDKFNTGNSLYHDSASNTAIKELGEQIVGIKESIKALERLTRSETRHSRERTRRMEQTLEHERTQLSEFSTNTTREIQMLSEDVKALVSALLPQAEDSQGLLRKVFSGSKSKRRNSSWTGDRSGNDGSMNG
ncbi:hypothetical protein DFS34DRAFT_78370 [Phlyctochytrium arcticum]|nr:hypothetical protein DFS34DRAFT_78370 [Phlyctochytrium arcticum]